MQFPKLRRAIPLATLAICGLVASVWGQNSGSAAHVPDHGPAFHHYCKVIAPDPQIVCQIYDNTDPNAPLTQIEFIMAKKLTRPSVKREDWNRLWHDHAVEIAGGRVQVLDLPPDKAKEVADLVATTDGIIYSFQFDGKLPNGKITMAQAVGHRPLTAAEYERSRTALTAAMGGAH